MEQAQATPEHPEATNVDLRQPESMGHVPSGEQSDQQKVLDPRGENGPTYEVGQVVRGREINPGGSVSPNSDLSHADSGDNDA